MSIYFWLSFANLSNCENYFIGLGIQLNVFISSTSHTLNVEIFCTTTRPVHVALLLCIYYTDVFECKLNNKYTYNLISLMRCVFAVDKIRGTELAELKLNSFRRLQARLPLLRT